MSVVGKAKIVAIVVKTAASVKSNIANIIKVNLAC
jgi:hypothetical protein